MTLRPIRRLRAGHAGHAAHAVGGDREGMGFYILTLGLLHTPKDISKILYFYHSKMDLIFQVCPDFPSVCAGMLG
jgi:hypothetical protein